MASFVTPAGRQPRGLLKINGAVTSGWTKLEVVNNSFYSADTFHVELAANALPAAMNLAWFSQQQDMFVEAFMGVPPDATAYGPADLTSWIYGQVDDIDIDPVTAVIKLRGRDLTRVFIDTKTTEKWPNQTSSQIATQLANGHGLTPVVTATSTPVGKFYLIDAVQMADDRSEWDLLNYLANAENFQVYVRGTNLYFGPKVAPSATAAYQLIWEAGNPPSANFETIEMRRALTVSRGIQVVVRSWNVLTGRGVVAKYPGTIKTIGVGRATLGPITGASLIGSGAQIYVRTVANFSQQQAEQFAQNWYQQLVQHEMKIDVTMPGDDSLDVTGLISLTGTGTAFDQVYYPDAIERTMSFDGGYSMRISAKNHSPDSQVSL